MITKRQQQILNLIISLYTQTHKAVGSKALMTSINASSATIRNDMKTLETLGFIQKEHTSSGRVPSVTGYKYFVENFLKPGKLDNNDAVQFDDAYNEIERNIINVNLGTEVQNRYLKCQEIYKENHVNATFKNYENVGHWTTSEMNLEVIKFFFNQMQIKQNP